MNNILTTSIMQSLGSLQSNIKDYDSDCNVEFKGNKPCRDCAFGCSGSCANRCQDSGRGGRPNY